MADLIGFQDTGSTMPALFVGHGSPTNALEDNELSRSWADAGRALPRPTAILICYVILSLLTYWRPEMIFGQSRRY